MKPTRLFLVRVGFAGAMLMTATACGGGGKQNPMSPTQTSPAQAGMGTTMSAPVLKSPIANEQTASRRPALSVMNVEMIGDGDVTYQFEVSEVDSFPAGSRTSSASAIPQGDGATSWQPPSDLIPAFVYYWHARATNGPLTTDWSKTETFRTP
jgi:hypothetical protein